MRNSYQIMKSTKSKKLKTLLINIIIFLVLLIIMELGLRIAGFKPGPAAKFINIKEVDSLIVMNEFFTDSNGFYIANKDWDWEEGIHINSNGFRTRELNDTANPTHKKRILLLGDSFTWGIAADPISNCFGNLLEKEGFQVFNLGIPGTDPAQYTALAKRYIPKLKPDIVLVSFYMGNDWMKDPRQLTPYENIYHVTNAGGILAHFDGKYYADPHKAYALQKRKLFNKEFLDPELKQRSYVKWLTKKVLYKTVIGSKLLSLQSKYSSRADSYQKNASWYSNVYLKQIRDLCQKASCRFELFIIPWQAQAVDTQLFGDLNPHIITKLSMDDYHAAPNDHFNNSGHKKYFEYILETLSKKQN